MRRHVQTHLWTSDRPPSAPRPYGCDLNIGRDDASSLSGANLCTLLVPLANVVPGLPIHPVVPGEPAVRAASASRRRSF